MIIPIAAPRYWLAPKRLAAEIATKIGIKINGAADINWIMLDKPLIIGFISTIACGPNKPLDVKKLFKAINKPPATKAGMIGTKISDKSLIKAMIGLNFLPCSAIFFRSSVEASFKPVSLINSS
ncbi:hypothetical protein IMSAG117_00527 [Lactobacillaceae bacterium]|nr:hypothetical protein IMSAG117_00527 [Lactobacillaceae bacterium]